MKEGKLYRKLNDLFGETIGRYDGSYIVIRGYGDPYYLPVFDESQWEEVEENQGTTK